MYDLNDITNVLCYSGQLADIEIPKFAQDAFELYETGCSAAMEVILLSKEIKSLTTGSSLLQLPNLIVRYGKSFCRLARENKKFEVCWFHPMLLYKVVNNLFTKCLQVLSFV